MNNRKGLNKSAARHSASGRRAARPWPTIGLDIIEVDRIRAVSRRNPRFLQRVFSPSEIRYCQGKAKAWQHFAVRFAAKEAVWKALGDGGLTLRDISVSRDADGRPGVMLRGRPAPAIQLSLSHSDGYAAAVALRLP